jgi:Holliday junction DNA helicase RuvA
VIVFIEGVLDDKHPARAVINCAGVGYELNITINAYEQLPALGESVRLYSYHAVRDDAELLYGFASRAERALFEMLLGVSSIGPALALNVLSGLPVDGLRSAIAEGDVKRLSRIKGIGKKTAERIVLELRDRVTALAEYGETGTPAEAQLRTDAVRALVALGYQERDAHTAVEQVLQAEDGELPVEEIVRRALGVFQ